MKTKKQEYPKAGTTGLHAAALAAIAAGLLIPRTARAAELIDTFDTTINTAVWVNQSSYEAPQPTAAVEGGRVVVGAGTIPAAGLLSVDSFRLDQSFTLGVDVTMQPLSRFHEANLFLILRMGNVNGGGIGLQRQLGSGAVWQSYEARFVVPPDFIVAGDPNDSFADPVEDAWPLETNHLQLDWDTATGLLTGSYDGVGGRQSFPSLSLYDSGYSPDTLFRIGLGMGLSAVAFAENRTGTSFDNLSFQQVPEPSALWLGVVAGLGLLGHRRRDCGGEVNR